MAEAGVLAADVRAELIDGEVYDMSPMNRPHLVSSIRARDAVLAVFSAGFTVTDQLPVRLSAYSEPAPDVAVIEGDIEQYGEDEPWRVVLVIEISDTCLRFDRTTKARLYASAGVPEYWIVDLINRRVEVRTEPAQHAGDGGQAGYARTRIFLADQEISPQCATGARIKFSDLLPKLAKGK
jgi:Uma2 family endonuclease